MNDSSARASASLPHPHFTLDLCRYPMAAASFYTATTVRELNHIRNRGFLARAFADGELGDLGVTVEMSEQRGSRPFDVDTANRWLKGRNGGASIAEPITLAELFAKTRQPAETGA